MTDQEGSVLNLRPIFNKLGHQLEEIRVRSLKNLLSKLEHQLVCDADLVQEKHLHIRLLEWFNFSSCPLQQQVLALVLRFTKHPSAAQIYLDIGGVDFLTQLRTNLDPAQHRLVDAILDNLYHLPAAEQELERVECLYQQHKHVSVPPAGSSQSLPSQFLQTSLVSDITENNTTDAHFTSMGRQLSPETQDVGYFGQPRGEETGGPQAQGYGAGAAIVTASCFKFSTFPWVPLTPTDRHVLSSTDSSLKSKDVSLVVSACEFLSDVVFQDFPAEVFLQRPIIVKSLLSLLSLPASGAPDTYEVSQQAVQTLRDLTAALQARIYFYQDPALYTPKHEFNLASSAGSTASYMSQSLESSVSADSRPSVIGYSDMRHRGDGQDGDNSSQNTHGSATPEPLGSPIEQTDISEIQSLQFLQWSIPQFCLCVLERLLPCLKTPHEAFILHGLQLSHQVAALLGESVTRAALWQDESLPARELKEKIHDVLEMLGDVMYLHHHGNLSPATPPEDLRQHRVAYLGLGVFWVRVVETLIPADKVSAALPDCCTQILTLLCEDEALALSLPDVRTFTADLLAVVRPERHVLYTLAQSTAHSFRSTCAYLMDSTDMTDDTVLDLLSLSEDAIRSLAYHQNLQLIEGCVQQASYICKKTSPNPTAVKQSQGILLTLLAYPIPPVRLQAYNSILTIVKDALGVEHVIEPTSNLSASIAFLFDRRLLYQILCFGCTDAQAEVQIVAEEVLLYLLQSQLLIPAARWQQLLEALGGVLPILQGLGEPDSNLSKSVLGLLSTDPQIETGNLPTFEKFRATLRLMYSDHPRLRMEGLGRLAWFLANEQDSMRKLPLFSELDVANLTNVFVVDPPRSLVDDDLDRSVFTPDSMQKVYEIFVSENVEATVRHSAGEQLAIILQDPHLHEAFHKLGAIKKMVSLLKHGVKKPEKNTVNPYSTVLPCILKILRSLVQHNSSLRHKWAHDSKLYYPILRAGLLHHRDSSARKELSELLAFLLFDEVAQVKIWEDATPDLPMTFSLPLLITKRYSLPVKCPTHHLMSPHTVLLPPDPDPLRSGGLAEMLRVAWGVAWCDGVQGLIDDSRREEGESNKMYHRSLALTPVDRAVLSTSYLPHALRSCIHAVDNATGHGDVTRAVLRLCSYLVVTTSQDVSEVMDGLTWRDALSRFTRVIPSSTADESLLSQLLQFLLLATHTPAQPPGFSPWVVGLLSDPKGALLWLLGQGDTAPEELPQGQVKIKRQLNRHLLKFVQTFIGKYPYSLVDKSTFECVRGDLTQNLLTRINRHDTTHFYNLASLESTLLCLLQVTARPGWSVGSPDHTSLALSLQTLQNLSEVISAFHVGRGGVSMSYMGRGVTRSATVCLRHLAHEMASQLQSKDWPRNWLFSRQATADTVGESGLHWLIPLWSYRDTEVRSAGVGIAAALTSTEAGRITMATQCQHIPGGIWGTAFSLLLDHSECSIVRQQACLLLTNLTSQPMPSGSVETAASVWQGPIVRNEETQVSLVGLSALVALLHHSQFYQEMMVLLANTYLQPAIHPVSVASGSRVSSGVTTGSQATITTTGSMTPAGTQMTDLTASSGQLMTSTPVDVSTHSPQVALSSRLTPQPPGAALSHRTDTGATTPASVIGDQTGTTLTSDLSDGREYHSVVAPCLVSAVCGLLGNLVALAPDDTLASITKENMHTALLQVLDVGLLEAYRTELCDTPYRAQFLLAYRDLLRVHTDVLELVRRCGTHDAGVRRDVLQNTAAIRQIVRALGVSYQGDADTEQTCAALWQAAYTLLASLIHAEGQGALAALTPVIVKHWSTVAGRTVSILQAPALSESPLWVSALTTLSLLLCEEARLLRAQGGHRQADTYYVLDRLDNSGEPDGKDLFTMTSGALLCQALIRAYDAVTLRPLDQTYTVKMAVINALKSLLVISTTAKVTALEAGLVETITEHLKHLVHKLSLDALELRAGDRGARRRDSPALAEVRLTADLLRNAMYANTDVKLAAYECGLAGIVHNLWVWCLMDQALMDSTLALLATFTARCTQACSSLAFTSPSQTVDKSSALRTTITNNSLVHALIKYLQRESGGAQAPGPLLKAGYGLLANLTLSQECRGILWKSNFLHEFASMSPQKHKKQKKARVLESLWLDLLVNLSFSTEGQNMVLKVDDAVSLLLEFGTDSSDHNQSRATLVLRNLCFHAPNKPKLLANDDLVPFFLHSIESSPGDVKKVACSALLALAYNNQKAKGVLKNAHIQRKLQTSYTNMVNVGGPPGGGGHGPGIGGQGPPPWAQSCINDLKGLLVLLRA